MVIDSTLPESIIIADGYGWKPQLVPICYLHVDWLGVGVEFHQVIYIEVEKHS